MGVYLLICVTISSAVPALTLPSQITLKPRRTQYGPSTTEFGSGSLATPPSRASRDIDYGDIFYRYINSNNVTCILLQADALVEVRFLLNNFYTNADSYIPNDALVNGNCKNEDASALTISWKGFSLLLQFAKTAGRERWYIGNVELTVNPELPQLHGIQTQGKPIKLYNKEMQISTPIGKSYTCTEISIDLAPDEEDDPPAGLSGSVILRQVRLQPFMYKNEDFEAEVECKPQRANRDESSNCCGINISYNCLMTVTVYGIFRYLKV